MIELKHCPFCGTVPFVGRMGEGYDFEMPEQYCVECPGCKARTEWFSSQKGAAGKWNQRMKDDFEAWLERRMDFEWDKDSWATHQEIQSILEEYRRRT